MRLVLLWVLLVQGPALLGQYQFNGQVSEDFKNTFVYLSLVEDYRKTSRVYTDQIVQKVRADSLGHFSFTGNELPRVNRMYRIHVDGCTDELTPKNHFLRECAETESLLFIANGQDTLLLPLANQQAFCSVESTNPASAYLLEVESLKEDMILDFIDVQTEKAKILNFEKWFARLQEYGIQTGEPLVELYLYDFLSDRKNETYSQYLKSLPNDSYYNELLDRLHTAYPSSSFLIQYENELKSDQTLASSNRDGFNLELRHLVYLLVILVIVGVVLQRRKKSKLPNLSPQEQKVVEAIRKGKTNKEIASELFISLSTVKTHINSIYKKLGVSSRSDLLAK